MTSLVEELQEDALNHEIRVTELLHKSLVVATKLRLDDFASWVRLELEGYGDNEVAPYRVLHGAPHVLNPEVGYQPLFFSNVGYAEQFAKMSYNKPIGEIEYNLDRASQSDSDSFHISFSPKVEKYLMDAMGVRMQPFFFVNASQFQCILDAVRKIILEWSLKLEEDGILGEGISFSADEKKRARGDVYNIKNFVHGNIHDSQIQIEVENGTQNISTQFDISQIAKLARELRNGIGEVGIDDDCKKELDSEISTLEAQIKSPNPKNSIIGESLTSIRRILEGAGGNLVASGLLNQVGAVFGV